MPNMKLGRWPLGIGDVCFYPRVDNYEAARRGAELGFHHLDLHSYWDDGDESKLAIPIGSRMVNTGTASQELSEVAAKAKLSKTAESAAETLARWPLPKAGWGYPPPPDVAGAWDYTVAHLRACPTALVEPWAGSVCATNDVTRELMKAVPGLRLIVDVGHLVFKDNDPYELLPYANIIQLRDCAPGKQQLPVGDGVMDFRRVKSDLEKIDYKGTIVVEYFDLYWVGYPLKTPLEFSCLLAGYLTAL
jgi:sugar phosphate isomerase/epimerase